MIKKSLLLTLLLALLVPWAVNAQETLTVYDGTNTNSNVPFYGLYADTQGAASECVIPSDQLADMAGGQITAMKFYISSSAAAAWTGTHQVYLGEVDATTLTGITGPSAFTVVKTASFDATGTELTIEFDEPYTYGGGNLLIGTYVSVAGNYKSAYFYGVTQTENTGRYRSTASGNGNAVKFLPKTTFTYEGGSGVTCEKPETFEASNVTSNSAELTWTGGSGLYNIELNGTVIEESYEGYTYNLADLTPATNYTVKVQSLCPSGEIDPETGDEIYATSGWKTVSFITACAAITTFPWTETFESYASGNFSDPCWVNEHIEGGGTQLFKVYTSTNAGNTTHQLQLPDMNGGTLTKLVLPEMTLPENYEFSIDIYRGNSTYNNNYPYEGIRVYASTDGEIEGATELAFIPRQYTVGNDVIPAEATTGWYTYELPIPMSGTCYIILRGESQYCTSTYMDNLTVMAMPTCVKPTNLAQTHTNHSATLSWTAGNEGQNAWQIAYSTTSFDPNAADFDLTTVEVIDNVEETSYTFDKTLDANTHDYMYVRGYCGDEDYSKWVGIDFTTGTANPSPTVTTVDEITPVSAVLRWTAAGGDYLESYDIYYSQTSGAPAAGADSLIQYKGIDAGFTSYILQNLTEGYWYVYMRAYHGETDGYSSWTPYYGYGFQVPEACPEPTGLAANDPTPNSITLTWTEGAEWQYAWKVAYSTNPEFNPEEMDPETFVDVFGQQGPTITCTVNGLESETTYYFKVLGNCNSPYGDSDWTDAVSETTLVACPVPTDLNVTVAQTSATLNWNGYSDSYTVQYRTAGGYDVELVEGFESGSMPAGWTIEGDNQVSTKTWQVGVGDYSTATGTHSGDYNALIKHNSNGDETYLITPALDFSGVSEASLNLWYINRNWTGDIDEFGVYYRVNGGEWNELFSTTEAHSTWTELNLTLTGLAANTQIGFKCYDNYGYGIGLDDITILGGEYNEPGEWITYNDNVTSTTATIEGLEIGTKYDAQVKANCGEEYSDYVTFTTMDVIVWNNPDDWTVPEEYADVTIPANTEVIIPSGFTAYADEITIEEGGQITMEPGAQLYHSNEIPVTVQMNVEGYDRDNGGYVLIAAPAYTNEIDNTLPVDGTNLNTGEFDLYAFDQSYPGAEWRNFKAGEFDALTLGQGYLYANSEDINNIVFNGQTKSTNTAVEIDLHYSTDSVTFRGWNLVGNPFTCNASVDKNFYTMNNDGDEIIYSTSNTIEVMEGIFVVATEEGQSVTFSAIPANDKSALNINLSQGRGIVDRASILFNEGDMLPKFQLNPNHTKVYIPMDGKDYAVVRSEEVGELPVNFKAETDGTYNLSFTTEEVSFNYLHLIDNMTGADVDLLETPSYTFEARSTDYANRFKLVFATGTLSVSENFAFFNNGNLLINNEGEATVQVIDINGRILSNETINGSANINVNGATGVYMIRLINGENVRVQKVVVR